MTNLVIPSWISNLLIASGVAHTEPNWNASVENGNITLKLEWNHVNTGTVVALPPNSHALSPPSYVQPPTNTYKYYNQYHTTPYTNKFNVTGMNRNPTSFSDGNHTRYVAPPRFNRDRFTDRSRSDGDRNWRSHFVNSFSSNRRQIINDDETTSTDATITAQNGSGMIILPENYNEIQANSMNATIRNIQVATSASKLVSEVNDIVTRNYHEDRLVHSNDATSAIDKSELMDENENILSTSMISIESDNLSISSDEGEEIGLATFDKSDDTSSDQSNIDTADAHHSDSESGSVNTQISSSCITMESQSIPCGTMTSDVVQDQTVTDDVKEETAITQASDGPRKLTLDESPESLGEWTQSVTEYLSSIDSWNDIIKIGWKKVSWQRKIPNRGFKSLAQVIALDALFAQINDICPFKISDSQFKGTESLQSIFKVIYTYYCITMPNSEIG